MPQATMLLPENYYLENFNQLMDLVWQRYQDILSADHQQRCQEFQRFSRAEQQLWLRLILRKGPLFLANRLDYPEIAADSAALIEVANALVKKGWLLENPQCDPRDYLQLLTVAQLKKHFANELSNKNQKRDGLLEQIEQLEPQTIIQRITATSKIWQPLHQSWLDCLKLLYFGNGWQDLSEFIISELGHVRYESYSLDQQSRQFQSSEQIEQALVRDQLWQQHFEIETFAQQLALIEQLSSQLDLQDPANASLINAVARNQERFALTEIEQQAQLQQSALDLYRLSQKPPARERSVRLFYKMAEYDKAWQLIKSMQQSPEDISEQLFVDTFYNRLARKLKQPLLTSNTTEKPWHELAIEWPIQHSAEDSALDYFAEQGFSGFWSENHFWMSLAGLLMWDIVFAPLAGAFTHPFQSGPHGFRSPQFYLQRRQQIETRLQTLNNRSQAIAQLEKVWKEKQGITNPLVSWQWVELDDCIAVVDRINTCALQQIIRQLLLDPASFCKGLPDLLIYTDQELELWEVKGPGDQLQPAQKQWLQRLNQFGIEAAVLWINKH